MKERVKGWDVPRSDLNIPMPRVKPPRPSAVESAAVVLGAGACGFLFFSFLAFGFLIAWGWACLYAAVSAVLLTLVSLQLIKNKESKASESSNGSGDS